MLSSKLLLCKICMSSDKVVATLCTKKIYQHLHEVKCLKCKCSWLVCVMHDKRFSQRKLYLAKRHLREIDHPSSDFNALLTRNNNHSSENSNVMENDSTMASENIDDNSEDNFEVDAKCASCDEIEDAVKNFLSSERNVSYEDQNILMKRYIESESISPGNGIRRIVACAFARNLSSDHMSITYKEAVYHLKATLFCYSLTASQLSQFTDLSHMIGNIFYYSTNQNNSHLRSHPPFSNLDVQQYYLWNNTSIAKNIPIPTVNDLHDHAYLTIKEALQHFLCFQSNIDGMLTESTCRSYKNIISNSSSIPKEKICDSIRSKVKQNLHESSISPLIIYIILWSDDFEPNNVKQHKKSTWIKTVTFAPPLHCQTSSKHTYIIALSAKTQNHEYINSIFTQELKELSSPTYIYCKATNSNIPVVLETLAVSADRPERSSLNYMLGHNGLTSRRWRFSAYIDPLVTKSCFICSKNRINHLCDVPYTFQRQCSQCCDWNFHHPKMGMKKPPDYPSKQHPDSPPPPFGREV